MINRRKLLGIAAVAGAALVLTPELLPALQVQQPDGKLIQRAIPSTGEMIPAISLAFSNHPSCADHAALKEVVKTFADGGGKVFDATLTNPASEQFHITAATDLGLQSKFFLTARGMVPAPPGPPQPGTNPVKAHVESLLSRFKVAKIDLIWLPVTADPALLAFAQEEKKAGRVRYIGVHTIVVQNQSAQLETLMRNEPIDFIGVDYDISNRHVEAIILPLAQEKKIGVVAFFPFNNASGLSCTGGTSLFTRTAGKPLPAWAAEFDAKTWSQFFLKYALGHPAVTVARVGTTKAAHMVENLAGGVGRLPDEATRKRMRELIDALPPAPPPPQPAGRQGGPPQQQQVPQGPVVAVSVAILDRYVGEYRSAAGTVVTFRRDGDKLIVKPGGNPEATLIARSEIRFQDPRGPFFDFQVDGQGKVTGAILEQNGAQGPQRLPLKKQ